MPIPQTYLQPIKSGVHLAQTLFAVVAGCLALVVLTKDGGMSGATAFLFALVGYHLTHLTAARELILFISVYSLFPL